MRQLLALKPGSREHAVLARMHYSAGDFQNAVEEFRRALALEPGLAAAANDLAWTLATCPDEKVRNGRQAVELAEKLCPPNTEPPVEFLDTLAAAYAEVGRFDDAQKAASRAIQRVDRGKNDALFRRAHCPRTTLQIGSSLPDARRLASRRACPGGMNPPARRLWCRGGGSVIFSFGTKKSWTRPMPLLY